MERDPKLSVWGILGHRQLLCRVIFEDAELSGSLSKFPGSRNVRVPWRCAMAADK